jgi:hypothetical protein
VSSDISPPPPTPPRDDKDWTWVLDTTCPDCGYRADTPHAAVPVLLRGHVERWSAVLRRDDVRVRPEPHIWSDLEYACHVRDVYRVFGERLRLMLTRDDPDFPNWDQNTAALEGRYWDADPETVRAELAAAGAAIADAFAAVADDEWQRTGRRSNGSVFTIETLAWYLLHDDVHHLADVLG